MYLSQCEDRSIPRQLGGRLLAAALLVASALIGATWLSAFVGVEGLDVVILAAAAVGGGWLLNGRARVRGLPLASGIVMAVANLAGWALGLGPVDAAGGGGMFVALMLSAMAPTWTVGIGVTLLLGAAGYIALLL